MEAAGGTYIVDARAALKAGKPAVGMSLLIADVLRVLSWHALMDLDAKISHDV